MRRQTAIDVIFPRLRTKAAGALGLQLPRSTCRSGEPGSLWWTELQQYVIFTQWDALVREFQQHAIDILPASYEPTAYYRRFMRVDGVFGPNTASALGACLALSSYDARLQRLASEITNSVISRETIVDVIFFGIHVERITSTTLHAVTEHGILAPERPYIDVPDDVVLPLWGQPRLSRAVDYTWYARVPIGQARPSAPSETAAHQNGAVVTPAQSATAASDASTAQASTDRQLAAQAAESPGLPSWAKYSIAGVGAASAIGLGVWLARRK